MLTDQQIEKGKRECRYSTRSDILHEHNDCIRIAYEWLDAQTTISRSGGLRTAHFQTKHWVEWWGGRYVSRSDVEVAAHLHPRIKGEYPGFNLSMKLTIPNDRRLEGIGQAMAHPDYRERHVSEVNPHLHPLYKRKED